MTRTSALAEEPAPALTLEERVERAERALAALAGDLVGSSMNGRATRRPAIAAIIEEQGVEG